MFRKHLDNFIRNAVTAITVLPEDRREGSERRQNREQSGGGADRERRLGGERRGVNFA